MRAQQFPFVILARQLTGGDDNGLLAAEAVQRQYISGSGGRDQLNAITRVSRSDFVDRH